MKKVYVAAMLIFVLVMGSSIANSLVRDSDSDVERVDVKKKRDLEETEEEVSEDEGRGEAECNSTLGVEVE